MKFIFIIINTSVITADIVYILYLTYNPIDSNVIILVLHNDLMYYINFNIDNDSPTTSVIITSWLYENIIITTADYIIINNNYYEFKLNTSFNISYIYRIGI